MDGYTEGTKPLFELQILRTKSAKFVALLNGSVVSVFSYEMTFMGKTVDTAR